MEGVTTTVLGQIKAEDLPHYTQAGAIVSAEGKLKDVFRWIYDLNRPEDFYLLRDLKVTPHRENPEEVFCQFQLLRWYAPKSEETPPQPNQ